jgi:hypothetical protein
MYEKTEPFMFMHYWKMLRNEPKWNDRFLKLNNTLSRVEMPMGASGNENGDTSRPEGCDSAKRCQCSVFSLNSVRVDRIELVVSMN